MFSVTADALTPRPNLEPALRQPAAPWALASAADRLLVLRGEETAPLVEYRASQDGQLTLQPPGPRQEAVRQLWPALRGTAQICV